MGNNEDQRLKSAVERFVGGEEDAFSEIYELTKKYLYYTIKKSVNEQEAEDILQNTYLDIYRSLNSIREIGAFKSWAGTIAQSNIYHFYQKNTKFEVCSDEELIKIEEDDADLLPEDAIDNKETARLIHDIIQQLPDVQKETIVAFYYNQMSIAEIAGVMGMPEGTVKTNLYRGKAKIKEGVLKLEKNHGTKLYTVGLASVLFFLFGEEAAACELPVDGLCKVRAYQQALLPTGGAGKIPRLTKLLSGNPIVKQGLVKAMAVVVSTGVVCGAAVGIGLLVNSTEEQPSVEASVDLRESVPESESSAEQSVELPVEPSVEESSETSYLVESAEEEPEIEKIEVTIDLEGIARAYVKAASEPDMSLTETFGLFDITGDGIPELFSGEGASVYTYWNGDRSYLLDSLVILDWYYDPETDTPFSHYSYEIPGPEESVTVFTFDTSDPDMIPYDWPKWTTKSLDEVSLEECIQIDFHTLIRQDNLDVEKMKETIRNWCEEQEKYHYTYL